MTLIVSELLEPSVKLLEPLSENGAVGGEIETVTDLLPGFETVEKLHFRRCDLPEVDVAPTYLDFLRGRG